MLVYNLHNYNFEWLSDILISLTIIYSVPYYWAFCLFPDFSYHN